MVWQQRIKFFFSVTMMILFPHFECIFTSISNNQIFHKLPKKISVINFGRSNVMSFRKIVLISTKVIEMKKADFSYAKLSNYLLHVD